MQDLGKETVIKYFYWSFQIMHLLAFLFKCVPFYNTVPLVNVS